MLGNIKFIGELFRQQMLSPKIMHHCLTTLLKEMDNPDESYIECCINLLRSVGKLIDVSHGKEYVTAYFERLKILGGAASPLSTRVKFMCQDICETRRNRWKARHKEQRTIGHSTRGRCLTWAGRSCSSLPRLMVPCRAQCQAAAQEGLLGA